MAFGWTYDYIGDAMDLPAVTEIYRCWADVSPPVHRLLAGFVGFKSSSSAAGKPKSLADGGDMGDLGDLMRMLPNGGV